MRARLSFLLIALAWISNPAWAAGSLEIGSTLTKQDYTGQFKLYCSWGNQVRDILVNCFQQRLRPDATSRFTIDEEVDADSVTLSNVLGAAVSMTKKFRSRAKKSLGKFEIWDPYSHERLIELGQNKVNYALTKDGKTVKEGSFEVSVEDLSPQMCAYRQFLVEKPHCGSEEVAQQYCPNYFAGNICR
jgi:hypothetical protein